MDWTQFREVLIWLTGIGSPAVIAYALSWIAENVEGWKKVPSNVKFILPMIVSVLLSVGANQVLKYPDFIAEIQPWFQVVMSSIIAYLSSQKAYVSAKKDEYGKRFGEAKG